MNDNEPWPECMTKEQHDEVMRTRRRPVTQRPIQRRTSDPVDVPKHHTVTHGDRLAELVEKLA